MHASHGSMPVLPPIGSQPLLPNGRSGGLRRARVAPRNRPRGPWGWLEVPGVSGRPGKVTGGRSHNPFHQGEDKDFDLRIHQDWINKKWVIALEKTLDYLGTSNMHCDDNASSIVHFYKRMMVEIRSDEIPRFYVPRYWTQLYMTNTWWSIRP
ncbi:hypothetical protein SAY86_007821 [Trapa natans]|uniref:Uncharacterized protein n=1 Tax=Trapa natans TaxID=22666 RepID=A0AAN7LBK4_TRANT|nr:hypothetical protein SAY86_007821 [Trapa natans]